MLRRTARRCLSSSLTTEDMVAGVREKGFVYIDNFLSREASDSFAKALLPRTEEILKKVKPLSIGSFGIGSANGFHEVTQRSPGRYDVPANLREMEALDSKFKSLATAALGCECELAFAGVVVSDPGSPAQLWHVDSLHVSKDADEANLVNVLVPLVEDVSEDMGPTEFVSGSHKLTNHHNSSNFGPEIAYQDPRNKPELLQGGEVATLKKLWSKTEALIFDDRIMHRGGPNASRKRRYLAYFSYRRSDFVASNHFEAVRSLDKFLIESSELCSNVRLEFPRFSLRKTGVVADGAGGSQVHESVIKAVSEAMVNSSANVGGKYEASKSVTSILEEGRLAFADFFQCDDPSEIVFGQNATSLNIHLGNALFKKTTKKKNIVVSALDHDSNVGLWANFAEGLDARIAPLRGGALDSDKMIELIDSETLLVCVGLASNGLGSVTDCERICKAARKQGALSFVDAVHGAPHLRLDVLKLNCDFCVASPYKFFGPHLGVLYGRRHLLESLKPDKIQVSDDHLPSVDNAFMSKWETGTQQFEIIKGATAAIDYLATLGDRFGGLDASPTNLLSLQSTSSQEKKSFSRRHRLDAAYAAIAKHEDALKVAFLKGAASIPKLKVYGYADPHDSDLRTSTFSVAIDGLTQDALVDDLVDNYGICCTGGTHYCNFWGPQYNVPGAARLSFLHYNSLEDIDFVLKALKEIASKR